LTSRRNWDCLWFGRM